MVLPVELSKEPVFPIVTLPNGIHQVILRIQLCIPLPQSILPEPDQDKFSKKEKKIDNFVKGVVGIRPAPFGIAKLISIKYSKKN